MAAEAEEAEMIRLMEERQVEEERIAAAQAAMEAEKREAEWNARWAEKERWRAEKRRRQEEEEDVPVVAKRVRRKGEVEDEPQAEVSGSGTGACWNCRSRNIECRHEL